MPGNDVTLLCGAGLGPLANAVGSALGAHCGVVRRAGPELPPGVTPGEQYAKLLLRIFARCVFGARVVIWLPDGGPPLTAHQRRSLERVFQGLRPVVLVEVGGQVYPSWVKAAGGGLPVYPLLEEAAPPEAALAHAFRRTPLPSASSKNLGTGLLEERLEAVRPGNPGAGTGSWRPAGAILVGDRPNPRSLRARSKLDQHASWPFVSQVPGGCSSWLSEQLEALGVPETMLYWVNAYRADGTSTGHLGELHRKLCPQLVVALGKAAAEALDRDGVAYEQVHHPQHWKRFHHGERYRLLQLLGRLRTRPS